MFKVFQKGTHRVMLWKFFKIGKWVVILDLISGVVINAAWALGWINPLGWGQNVATVIQATMH